MNSFSFLEPVCCSMSSSNCCFLTCIQISQEADQVVWYSRGEWKSWLKTQKMKIMESGPITSWEIDWETVETVSDFIFLGSKITADGDCSHEIKRRLLLGRTSIWPSNLTRRHTLGETHNLKRICTSMFIVALFTIARIGKQLKCSSTEKWILMWFIYTM